MGLLSRVEVAEEVRVHDFLVDREVLNISEFGVRVDSGVQHLQKNSMSEGVQSVTA